ASAVGAPLRLREADGPRHRRRVRRAAAHARLAEAALHERLGPRVEPWRLDPALDRAGRPARDTPADGGLLLDARERRQRGDAVHGVRRRAAGGRGGARPGPPRAGPRPPRRTRAASTRPRCRPCVTASTRGRTTAAGPRP